MPPSFGKGRPEFPGFTGKLMVDTFRGKVRTRAWPAKRGKNVHPQVRIQNDRFREAQALAKRVPGIIMNDMIEATKGSGLYPRDLLTKFILNGPFTPVSDEGIELQHYRPQLENVMWQGFALRLTSNQGITGGVLHNMTWPAPVLDTAGFFNAGSPTLITIPPGVAIMSFVGGWRRSVVSNDTFFASLVRVAPSGLTLVNSGGAGGAAPNFASGPIPVAEGETYALQAFGTVNSTALAERSFFTGTILDATV